MKLSKKCTCNIKLLTKHPIYMKQAENLKYLLLAGRSEFY